MKAAKEQKQSMSNSFFSPKQTTLPKTKSSNQHMSMVLQSPRTSSKGTDLFSPKIGSQIFGGQKQQKQSIKQNNRNSTIVQMSLGRTMSGVIDDETERYKVMEEVFNKEQREKDLQKTIEEFKKVDQEKLFNRKQIIKVIGNEDVEFNQNDNIFQIQSSQIDTSVSQSQAFKLAKGKNCFGCKTIMKKKSNIRQCDFCAKIGCKECVYKKFPYPMNQTQKGRICKQCETKIYIQQTMNEIFKGIQQKEVYQERMQKDIFNQQDKHTDNRYELEQLRTAQINDSKQHANKVDKLHLKIESKRERLEKLERTNKRNLEKINDKKEEVEEKLDTIKFLREQIENLEFEIKQSQDELRVKIQDEQYMRDYLKKLNPIQPKQGSFNKQNQRLKQNRNQGQQNNGNMNGSNISQSITEPSLTFSQLEQQEKEQLLYQQTGLDHLNQQHLSTSRHGSTPGTDNSSRRKKNIQQIQQQKSCCNDNCYIF
eukprot:403337136